MRTASPTASTTADGLVTEDPARRDLGNVALEDVQVGAADRDRLDPHNGIQIVPRHRIGDLVPGHRAFTVVHECAHDGLLLDMARAEGSGLQNPR